MPLVQDGLHLAGGGERRGGGLGRNQLTIQDHPQVHESAQEVADKTLSLCCFQTCLHDCRWISYTREPFHTGSYSPAPLMKVIKSIYVCDSWAQPVLALSLSFSVQLGELYV